jgi:hypothetical protein
MKNPSPRIERSKDSTRAKILVPMVEVEVNFPIDGQNGRNLVQKKIINGSLKPIRTLGPLPLNVRQRMKLHQLDLLLELRQLNHLLTIKLVQHVHPFYLLLQVRMIHAIF